jgi:hypothetical protein
MSCPGRFAHPLGQLWCKNGQCLSDEWIPDRTSRFKRFKPPPLPKMVSGRDCDWIVAGPPGDDPG